MLSRLTISKFALFRDAEIEFDSGFTAITGETGAGKSLIINAISFLAGAKTTPGMVRDGARKAVIEAEFRTRDGKNLLLRRELARDGGTRAFRDDSPISLRELVQSASSLVDITAQRAFSHLLDHDRHLDFLDLFARLTAERELLAGFHSKYSDLERRIGTLRQRREDFLKRRELIEFQLAEFDSLKPLPDEPQEIESEISRLEHFEEWQQNSARLVELLSEGESAVEPLLALAEPVLELLCRYDNGLKLYLSEFDSSRRTLKEIARTIADASRKLSCEPGKLEALRERQYALSGLVRKFGGSLQAALENWERLKQELGQGDESHLELAGFESQRTDLVKAWCDLAERVGDVRRNLARELEQKVVVSLGRLGVPEAKFDVRLTRSAEETGLFQCEGQRWRLDSRGAENAEFYLSANPGLEPKPLHQVASGGELSRLLLALKRALPLSDREATVFLDEIDTGVSGRVAELVGHALKELASGRQLIAITHLPQIASIADHHLKVSKIPGEDGTETEIASVTGELRVREIASLLSGGKITDAALKQAGILMKIGDPTGQDAFPIQPRKSKMT